uniref:hypothetical protein 42 n=1 Tax=Moniliophthora perniciosa TaxID=153609 RepID=UPI0000242337|nr:hypothetical protein 42 [Moniliophthora perniciosa]AAQ74333.1 hypothetical protein 42 [Moniliophthora perniciosa]
MYLKSWFPSFFLLRCFLLLAYCFCEERSAPFPFFWFPLPAPCFFFLLFLLRKKEQAAQHKEEAGSRHKQQLKKEEAAKERRREPLLCFGYG